MQRFVAACARKGAAASGLAAWEPGEQRVTADRGRVENVEAAEDAMRKVQRLKRGFARQKAILEDASASGPRGDELVLELRQWEEQLEAIRCDLAELLAERDRMRIAHDKLRERIDKHTLEPRSEPDRKVQSSRQPVQPRAAGESQDFTAIDRELERLNASMLRAFSQNE
jgi:hypothetical protein